MTPEQYQRVSELFNAARRLDAADRPAFLRAECNDDTTTRREVELMLAQHDDAPAFLDDEGSQRELAALAASLDVATEPTQIGRYQIIGEIGRGGMGVVYEAEQEDPRRHVALKVMTPGRMSREFLRRFRDEAAALGRLQHPGIAQIHEAGTDPSTGQPFFAMELIQGEPLLEYVRTHDLSVEQRLELIARICDALHHAHQKGIIHRDVKPANVLIADEPTTSIDGSSHLRPGQPKVLDFGVARATDPDLQATLHTSVGQMVGTVPYMSPEQASGEPSAIDIRSDVYSVGVIAYEMLAGRLPHDLNGKPLLDALQMIREVEPVRLGTLNRALRGDIETIVHKSLEKNKDRRYASAAEFAADIRRCLRDEPISARPATTWYQLWKFSRRHRTLIVAAVVAVLSLLLATVVSMRQAQVARSAQNTAETEREAALLEAYVATITSVANAISYSRIPIAREMLESIDPDRRGWEWAYLSAQLQQHVVSKPFTNQPHGILACAVVADRSLFVMMRGNEVVWYDRDLEPVTSMPGMGPEPASVAAFSRNGAYLATVHGSTVILWRLGEPRQVERVGQYDAASLPTSVAVSDDGRHIAVGSESGTDSVFHRDGSLVWDEEGRGSKIQFEFSRDGTRLLRRRHASHHFADIFDLATDDRVYSRHHSRRFSLATMNDDASLIVEAAVGIQASLIDVERDETIAVLTHRGRPTFIDFAAEAEAIVTGADDQTLRVWNHAGQLTSLFPTDGVVEWAGFMPDPGRWVVITERGLMMFPAESEPWTRLPALADSTVIHPYVYGVGVVGDRIVAGSWAPRVRIWDANTGAELWNVNPGISEIRGLTVASDGLILAAGSSGPMAMTPIDAATGVILTSRLPESVVAGGHVALNPDETQFVVTTYTGPRVYDIETGALVNDLGQRLDRTCKVAWSPDGQFLLVPCEDDVTRLCNAATGDVVHEIAHTLEVLTVAFSQDGAVMLTGSSSGAIDLWDTDTGAHLDTLPGHQGAVYALAFSPDGTRFVSGGTDSTIRVWDFDNRICVLRLEGHRDYVFDMCFTDDGRTLISGSGDGDVRIWTTVPMSERWTRHQAIEHARARLRPDVERLRAIHADDIQSIRAALLDDESRAWTDVEREALIREMLAR